jgi:hypothetical protein
MARWTGTLNLAAGTYQIKTTADDGIRVKVNGATVLDNWVDQGPTVTTRTFTVAASGNQAFVIEYYENTGTATSIFELSKL